MVTVRGIYDYYVTVDVDEDAIRTSGGCHSDFPGDCKLDVVSHFLEGIDTLTRFPTQLVLCPKTTTKKN